MTTSLKNRLRILSNHFAIITSRLKKEFYVGAEERGPLASSQRDGRIYRVTVPVLKKLLNLVISRRSRAARQRNAVSLKKSLFS